MGQAFAPDTSDWTFRQALGYALQPAVILRSLIASAIIWLIMASLMPSYSRLIFHGKLSGYFTAGLGITLVILLVTVFITSLLSSDHATLAVPQSPTAVIQGMIAGAVMAAAPADMSPELLFAALFWIIALSSVLTGGFVLLLGFVRAGGLIRYIPYPIVGGFMAGLGWLMFNAGFIVSVDLRIGAETLGMLIDGGAMARWLPSVLFALGILVLQARVKSAAIMPGAIIASFVLFYMWVYLVVGDVNILAEGDWFLPSLSEKINWQLPDIAAIAQINQDMLAASAGGIVTLIVVCALNLFFKASAQELVVDRELDFNRECKVNGFASIASGAIGGGIVGYHAPAFSSLVEAMGVFGRLVGVILALMFALTLLFGSAIFALVPRFIPAGFLMYFGLLFMKEWLLDGWFKLPRQDYLTVLVIALATALLGLLPGIALGLVIAISFFVLEYSRMDVIKQEFSGSIHRSNLDRSFAQKQLLRKEGDKILVLRLQGFVFFGTAYRFYEHVKSRIAADEDGRLQFIILDFRFVRRFDVSTIIDFKKLKRLADKHDIKLLISGVLPHLQSVLMDGEIVAGRSGKQPLFNDLDHALEWCENILLEDANLTDTTRVSVEQQLAEYAKVRDRDLEMLPAFLERLETKVGDTIFNQGDEPDALYFIESGRVDALLRVKGDRDVRLRSMTAGTVVGEVGFYLKKERSASIVMTEAGVLQRLSHEALRRMEESEAQTASAIHVLIASVLSDRLSTSNRVIQDLMD